MKWFSNTNGALTDMRRETPAPAYYHDTPPERQKRSGHARLSATFSESRPWNLISSSSQASDRSSSSSRKRRSLFGHRSSATPSTSTTTETSSRPASPRASCSTQHESGPDLSRSEPSLTQASRTSLSGLESWRSSIFSRRNSTKLPSFGEHGSEPSSSSSRYGSKVSNMRSSIDLQHRNDESKITSQHKLNKNAISQPFNFQHITHTQKNQLSELKAATDGELISEFWAASAYQAPQNELRGISAQTIESDYRQWRETMQKNDVAGLSDPFAFKRGPLAGVSSTLIKQGSYTSETASESDGVTPSSEGKRSFTQDGRSRSFTLHSGMSSAERLATIGIEQREPPAMVHPAFRAASGSSTPIYELPAVSLDSVPEEVEHVSPVKPVRRVHDMSRDASWVSPRSSPLSCSDCPPGFVPFPMGNAFAQAYGGLGASFSTLGNDQMSLAGEESIPSLTSDDSWENEVDLLYLVEAESTCDFDWTSLKSSRKGSSDSQNRRDSEATTSTRTAPATDEASIRPSSHRSSVKSYHDDGVFADFDATSPFTTLSSAQKLSAANSVFKRHSLVSVSNMELSTIPELVRQVAAQSVNSSCETITQSFRGKHGRSSSYSEQRPEIPKRTVRWSIATPSYLPEDVKNRLPSFTVGLTASLAEQMLFSAPLFPPPPMPLPEVPKANPTGLISPPLSPPIQSEPEFSMRRPSTPQDRALLQAAGRIVQRGRSARPATPSRLSQIQNAKTPSPRTVAQQPPATPPKKEQVQFQLSLFPTPPSSPPRYQQQQQVHDKYPAWI